jgi:hypothetical protein
MRTYALLGMTLTLVLAGCTSSRHVASASHNVPLTPLGSCETRVVTLDGVDLVLNANADSSLASVRVVKAANGASSREALSAIYRAFGSVRADTDLVARSSKWGLATWTDRCGRPVTFTAPARTPPVH